ncbi:hypothetical protein H4R35_006405 [Dimargaris xerosporica]|nr:hypothetical protein H4R35_006405 [Dimargaris xerosporica]
MAFAQRAVACLGLAVRRGAHRCSSGLSLLASQRLLSTRPLFKAPAVGPSQVCSRVSEVKLQPSKLSRLTGCAQQRSLSTGAVLCQQAPLVIGIRREDKNRWERRVALVPDDIARLVESTGARVLVQPSTNRVFPDAAFTQAGAQVQEDLSEADVIFGIKEIPQHLLMPNKTYLTFAHIHKGQPYNLPTLKTILDKRIRLIDYELITDDMGKRTVLFGRQAGWAGTIDGLHGLGQRLLAMGYHTPFLFVSMAHTYPDFDHARRAVETVGHLIRQHGLPRELGPLTFAIAGTGSVSGGAQEILDLLPNCQVAAADLPGLTQDTNFDHSQIYVVPLKRANYLKGPGNQPLDSDDFYQYPHKCHSTFHSEVAPYISVIINGLFWKEGHPRLLTTAQLKTLQQDPALRYRLLAIADIGCEINGPFEFVSHFTSIDRPFYYVDAVSGTEHHDEAKPGVQILGVENLPAELPLESSRHFSQALAPLMPELLRGNFDAPVLQRASLAADGHLMPVTQALKSRLAALDTSPDSLPTDRPASIQVRANEPRRVLLVGSGMVAKPLVEYLTRSLDIHVTVASNAAHEAQALTQGKTNATNALLDVGDPAQVTRLLHKADVLVSLVPAPLHPRLAALCIQHGKHMVTASYISPEMRALDSQARAASLLVLNEIGLDPGIDHLTAMRIIDDVQDRGGKVVSFISWCGGLPAPEASNNPLGYKFSWSPRGVLTAGLNPALFRMNGRTHAIPGDQLLARGFPNVPLYRGLALEGVANRNSLQYLDTYNLGQPEDIDTMFRGTLRYQGYSELMAALTRLGALNLDPASGGDYTQWPQYLCHLLTGDPHARLSRDECHALVAKRLDVLPTDATVHRVMSGLDWLGLFSLTSNANLGRPNALPGRSPTALDTLSRLLQARMGYDPLERDMVNLFHEIEAQFPNGQRELHTSRLVAYGDPAGDTAMAKTVGLPAAIATELILRGQLASLTGVHAPVYGSVYNLVLAKLAAENVNIIDDMVANGVSMRKSLQWLGGTL